MSDEDDDKVGYRRPPKTTRFRPGGSGNPRGRPKSKRAIGDPVAKLARRKVRTRDGRTITLEDGVWNAVARKALSGDVRSVQILLEALSAYQNRTFEPLAGLLPEDRTIYERAVRRLEKSGDFE
jgi:hypothetical protein